MSTPLFSHQIGQWTYEIHANRAVAFNKQDGERLYYELRTGQYGQPLFVNEPSRRIELPAETNFANIDYQPIQVTHPVRVGGVSCVDEKRNEVLRTSLSNQAFTGWQFADSGLKLLSPSNDVWVLKNVVDPDANRYTDYTYIGVYRPESMESSHVRFFELGDVLRLL